MQIQDLRKKKTLLLVSIAIVAVMLSLVFYWLNSRQQTANSKQQFSNMKPAVDVQMVQRRDMYKNLSLSGQTVALAQVDIAAKYTGRVVSVNAELGQQVSKGQVLIVQDTGDVDFQIAQMSAGITQAEADTTEAQASYSSNSQKAQSDYQTSLTNYNRYQSLYQAGAISREALDLAQQQMISAQAALNLLQNQMMSETTPATVVSKQAALQKNRYNLDALAKQRSDLILSAPRSGIIGYRLVEVGALVQAGQKLLTIVDNSQIYIDCSMSEKDVAQLSLELPVAMQIESLGKTYNGKIIYVSPAGDAKTQAFTVRIALINPDESLRSGMFAQAQIKILLKPQTIYVSKDAIQSKNGKNFVYIINGNNQVEQRFVELGLQNDQESEIISGINEGDQVAVSNLSRLKPGLTIVPTQSDPQAILSPIVGDRQGSKGVN